MSAAYSFPAGGTTARYFALGVGVTGAQTSPQTIIEASGGKLMPRNIPWQGITAGLIGLVGVLVYILYTNIQGDIGDLKKGQDKIVVEVHQTKVDLTKAIGAVEKQAAETNVRLDTLIELTRGGGRR